MRIEYAGAVYSAARAREMSGLAAAQAEAPFLCPLCRSSFSREYCRDRRRDFLECRSCGLVFVPSHQHLSREAEKERYDLHRNSPHDPGYRRFLSRIVEPLRTCLAPGSSGLDFGAGPERVLSLMFEEEGHRMTVYDPFYWNVPEALEQQYDFITATEVAEHLRDPGRELDRLWACCKPGGVLGIMTRPAVQREEFLAWQYKNDLTHICFFSPKTFTWLARRWGADLEVVEDDVVLFYKSADPHGPFTGETDAFP